MLGLSAVGQFISLQLISAVIVFTQLCLLGICESEWVF